MASAIMHVLAVLALASLALELPMCVQRVPKKRAGLACLILRHAGDSHCEEVSGPIASQEQRRRRPGKDENTPTDTKTQTVRGRHAVRLRFSTEPRETDFRKVRPEPA